MTQQTLVNPRRRYNAAGPDVMATRRVQIDGAATFQAGQFLRHDSDGLVYTEASNSVDFQYFALENVATAIGNDTTRKIVGVINANDIFEINAFSASVATAVFAETDIGKRYALYVASNICSCDVDDPDNDCFIVVEPSWVESPYIDDSADTYARGYVKVLDSVINVQSS